MEVTHVYGNMYEFFDSLIQLVNMLLLVYISVNLMRIKGAMKKDKSTGEQGGQPQGCPARYAYIHFHRQNQRRPARLA